MKKNNVLHTKYNREYAEVHYLYICVLRFLAPPLFAGADPGFQVRGSARKKIAPSGGRRENFGGISCEKSRFYAKNSYFFPIWGAPPPLLDPPLVCWSACTSTKPREYTGMSIIIGGVEFAPVSYIFITFWKCSVCYILFLRLRVQKLEYKASRCLHGINANFIFFIIFPWMPTKDNTIFI